VEPGTVKLFGTDAKRIVRETAALLDSPQEYQRMSRVHNPYGNGHASKRIEAALRGFGTISAFGLLNRPYTLADRLKGRL